MSPTINKHENITAITRLRKLWAHLSRKRRLQYAMLLALMLASAFAEVMSIGALLPFLTAIAAPEKLFAQSLVREAAGYWGIETAGELLKPLTIIFVCAAGFAGAVRLSLLWATTRLTFAAGADLSMEIYRRTLYQPYSVHIARSSSEIISAITTKTNSLMFDMLLPCLTIVNSSVLLLCICGALLYVNPLVALGAAGGFGVCYVLIAKLMHGRLSENGRVIAGSQTACIKALQEGVGGIRDVLLDGAQDLYCEIYRRSDRPLRRAQGRNLFISGFPRYAMESIGMIMVAGIAYYLSRGGGIAAALPTLGALALGVQRILPALQQAYNSWSLVTGNQAALADVLKLLEQPLPEYAGAENISPVGFARRIKLENIEFHYGENSPSVLSVKELEIPKGARVGITGATGSGKSTFLDIIMGLLPPTSGAVFVDDVKIDAKNSVSWQRNIAHVPQNIFLVDGSFTENIALGVPAEKIDIERVKKAAKQAQISGFIESGDGGYDAFVGERGVRLSGGQRQRVGIARALYKKAQVLVLDEATSALDYETEEAIMDSIEGLRDDLTIIIVAHRLSTLKKCDFIINLKNGEICRS